MKSPLPGIKVLLMGGSGTGKTYCIRTFIEAGITPLCIFTDNSFDVLGDIPAEKLSTGATSSHPAGACPH